MKINQVTALVTGANRGIGRALVSALLDAGARKIYTAARDPASVELADPTRVVPLRLDITDPAQLRAAAETASDVNLLINNAGVLEFGGFLDVSDEQIARQFATNLYGTLNTIRTFVPRIEAAGGGAIVNMLSITALASAPWIASYSATKAALWSMTQSLRAELKPKRIQVMAVFPAATATDMLAPAPIPKADPAAVARAVVSGIAAGSEDVFPDRISAEIYELWQEDHKEAERQLGGGWAAA